MARRYDSHTTTFSPEGRLYQVEYAMEAISHAGAAVGVRTDSGVVLAAEKKILPKVRRKQTIPNKKTKSIPIKKKKKKCLALLFALSSLFPRS